MVFTKTRTNNIYSSGWLNRLMGFRLRGFGFTGFTLAELLIALAILGLIATFTIPMVLQGSTEARWNTIAKEDIASICGIFNELRLKGLSHTQLANYESRLNFVKEYIGTIDGSADEGEDGIGNINMCISNSSSRCYLLPNGSVVQLRPQFTAFNNEAIIFAIDVDGQENPSGDNSLYVYIYKNGRVETSGTRDAIPTWDPPWFSW
jgi:prepilin-type N-terminal cleavage/methylation domain-containing protein